MFSFFRTKIADPSVVSASPIEPLSRQSVQNFAQSTSAVSDLTPSLSTTSCPVEKDKSQSEKDLELVNSDAWQITLAQAERDWNKKVEELRQTILPLQEARNFVELSICSAFLNCKQTPSEETFKASFLDVIANEIEETLSLKKYRVHMVDRTTKAWNSYPHSVDYYLGEFIVERNAYLEGALSVFINFAGNTDIIYGDMSLLNTVAREFKPELGGNGRLQWLGHTRKYAKEKLVGIGAMDFFPEPAPRYIRDHFKSRIEEAGSLYVMQTLAVLNQLESWIRPSTSQVGIDFENRLRETILSEFSDVVVETTPVTGDQGADLLIRMGSVRIAIQAKRYTGIVGNAAVQEIFAAKQFYDADFAMVVTTSRYTNPAKILAEKLEVTLATSENFVFRIRQLLQ